MADSHYPSLSREELEERLAAFVQTTASLQAQLDEARATNSSFHRRLQRTEGRMLQRVVEAKRLAANMRRRLQALVVKHHQANTALYEARKRIEELEAFHAPRD